MSVGPSFIRVVNISVQNGALVDLGRVPFLETNRWPEISPDGSYLIMNDPNVPIDIWLIENFDPEVR